jgi:pyruvate,orthophosphate dikinase
VFAEAKKRFPEYRDLHFWDFLHELGRKRFFEFADSCRFENLPDEERGAIIGYFARYYETQCPAEMTKMLHHIRSMFEIDTSKTQIWKFLYEISDEEFRKIFENVRFLDVSRVNIEKFITFLHVYRMIFDKYNFSEVRDVEKLQVYAQENLFDPPGDFFEKLQGSDLFRALEALLDLQYSLKWDVLLSGNVYEPVDSIEFKRHIAFGIPSMYGSYKEKKFDTLKVFFHCNLVRERLFETLVEVSTIFPHETLNYGDVSRLLKIFYRTFEIDGLANHELQSVMSLVDAPNLTISQFLDIITTLLSIHGEIADRFNETYKYVCKMGITNIGIERICEQYMPHESKKSIEIITDRFMRNQIMQSPLLQLFDNMLIRLRDRLTSELEIRGDVVCLNEIDRRIRKGKLFFEIGRHPGNPGRGELFVPLWQAGAKAQGLIIAANMDGIHVPEGIVISSEFYKRLREGDIHNPRFQRKVIYSLRKYIDEFTGYRYANPRDPVLLSVRSGAVFSMPGVMDTITNVGITQEIVDSFAETDPWFAYDCYRRLIHDFAISSYGMDRALFEKLMAQAKDEAGVDLKEKLSGKQMEVLTKKYRYAINRVGNSVPKDPYEQLFFAIVAVFQSWESSVAQQYRKFVNLSDQWGTAVIIQKMVFGNLSPRSITGVVHSHYLGFENIGLFGEYKTRAQGHDIVSGVARVFPISEVQRENYSKSDSFGSLEKTFPEHYRRVYAAVKRIRDRWGNEVEIEFTVENDVMYILQIRGLANHIFETEELAESPATLQEYLLGRGLAASGGAVSGRAVFDIGRIEDIRKKFPGDRVILIRPETNPEDVVGIQRSDGILTCVGGMTSHAVLQMRRLAKCGVSDFSPMKIDEKNNLAIVSREPHAKGKVILREGDFITIDGFTGHVYLGYHETVKKGL